MERKRIDMRQMTLLDVVAGRAADSVGKVEPIAMVSLACGDEIEQPILLNIMDTKRLADGLLAVLSHHGHESNEIAERHLHEPDWRNRESFDNDSEHLTDLPELQPSPDRSSLDIKIPSSAIADWLMGNVCPSCREPLRVQDVHFEEWTILARKWASRWTVTCGKCDKPSRLSVSCMPRKMRQ